MKKILLLIAACSLSVSAWAVKLSDYPYYEYDLRFTNPVCGPYAYDWEVKTASGKALSHKPANVYCTYNDGYKSGKRPTSPQYKLIEWINDPSTKEVFFTYLSISNSAVLKALCKNVRERNLLVTFAIDSSSDTSKVYDKLMSCEPASGLKKDRPRMNVRGHSGDQGDHIGYSHNKVFIINPNLRTQVSGEKASRYRVAYGSGNLSSGVVLHHENWHFVSTSRESYFAQKHQCLMNGVLNHWKSASEYSDFIAECKGQIEAPEEEDVKTYFVPGEGWGATSAFEKGIQKSNDIRMAAHRYSYYRLRNALVKKMKYHPETRLRIITDDDIYWLGPDFSEKVGDNNEDEYWHVMDLVNLGAENKYMETNHSSHLLHHNKFLIFNTPQAANASVFAGAGNLTGTAFGASPQYGTNFENFYYISIPEVVKAFNDQYEHMWDDLATSPKDMPAENALPQ